jgi:hypothetical protein
MNTISFEMNDNNRQTAISSLKITTYPSQPFIEISNLKSYCPSA